MAPMIITYLSVLSNYHNNVNQRSPNYSSSNKRQIESNQLVVVVEDGEEAVVTTEDAVT